MGIIRRLYNHFYPSLKKGVILFPIKPSWMNQNDFKIRF